MCSSVSLLTINQLELLLSKERADGDDASVDGMYVCSSSSVFIATARIAKAGVSGVLGRIRNGATAFHQGIMVGSHLVLPLDGSALEVGLFEEDSDGQISLDRMVACAPTPQSSVNVLTCKVLREQWGWDVGEVPDR